MTENRITPFLFEGEIMVRVIVKNDAPWFVAADACRALGMANAADAIKGLDDDEKGIGSSYTLRGRQEVIIVSESGLYALILKSRKPDAAKFRKWVRSEVLPSVRQTGAYTLANGAPGSRKPYTEWTLEERRVAFTAVETARKSLSCGAAAWMWEYVGLPMPPDHLLPVWWQPELALSVPASAQSAPPSGASVLGVSAP